MIYNHLRGLIGIIVFVYLFSSCNPCVELERNQLRLTSQEDVEDYEDFIRECDLSEIDVFFPEPSDEEDWDLSCFDNVTIVRTITGIPSGQVEHFKNLQEVDYMDIRSVEVAYFPSLIRANLITAGSGGILRDVRMPALESVEDFFIQGLSSLESISDLSSLENIGNLTIAGCEALHDIGGFTALKQLGPHQFASVISLFSHDAREEVQVGASFQQLSSIDRMRYYFTPVAGDVSWLSSVDSAQELALSVSGYLDMEDVCEVKEKLQSGAINMFLVTDGGVLGADGIVDLCE